MNFKVLDDLFIPSVTLILLGLALRISLRLLYGARGPSPDDAIHLATRILSWGLLIVPAVILFVMSINWLSLLMLAALGEAITEVMFARRAIQRQAAWDLLLASRDGNRPLGESLLFHQARFSGIVGRWYRRLATDLQNGAPWTDAIWNNRRALPREAAAYARLYQNATPAEAAAGEASESRDMGMHQLRQSVSQQFAYLTTVVAMAVAVLAFTGIKIIPSYQSILEDFSMQMPSSTQSLVVFFDILGDGAELPLIVLGLVLALLIVAVINIFYLCDRPILQPLTDRFGFARHQAQVLRLLALAAGQQIPIHEALNSLAAGRGCYSSGVVRRRIAAASRKISAGAEWQTALQKSSLLDGRDAAMLRAAQEVGNLPWTMRFLADRKLILLASRWSVWFQLFFTGAMLFLALLVFWFSLAMFAPIVEVIWQLA